MKEDFLTNEMNKYEKGVLFSKTYAGKIDKII